MKKKFSYMLWAIQNPQLALATELLVLAMVGVLLGTTVGWAIK